MQSKKNNVTHVLGSGTQVKREMATAAGCLSDLNSRNEIGTTALKRGVKPLKAAPQSSPPFINTLNLSFSHAHCRGVKSLLTFKKSHECFLKGFFGGERGWPPAIRLQLFFPHVSVLCYLASSIFPTKRCPQSSLRNTFENGTASCSRIIAL